LEDYDRPLILTLETLFVAADRSHELLSLTADVVIAHVTSNDVAMGELPALIARIHEGLAKASEDAPAAAEPQKPAVPIRSSIKPDHLVCLEDGRKMTMLKRYLMTHYRLTPDAYRAKWSLPATYPMVAPDYAARRRAIAQGNDFGRGRAKEAAAGVAALKPVKKATPVVQAAPAPAEKVAPVVEVAPKPAKKVARVVKAASAPAETAAPVAEGAPKAVKKATPAAKAAAAPAGKAAPVAEAAPTPATKAAPAKRKLLKPLFAVERAPAAEGGAAADEGRAQPLDILRMAITHKLCVTTTYNKRRVLLAPHIVFTRHDEPYLRAVTIELDDKRPKEAKLGTFKLVGLGPISLTGRSFEPFADYRASAPEYAGTTLVGLP
jgi:predicted transcriptional regulator